MRKGRGRRVGGAPQGMGAQRRGWGRSVGGTGEGERGRFALRGKGVFSYLYGVAIKGRDQ